MVKSHCRYTLRDAGTGEVLGVLRSGEGFTGASIESIRGAIPSQGVGDLRIVLVEWLDYDEVVLHLDRSCSPLPGRIRVVDSRTGETVVAGSGFDRVDKLVLNELFPDSGKNLRITSVDVDEDGAVRVWVRGAKGKQGKAQR